MNAPVPAPLAETLTTGEDILGHWCPAFAQFLKYQGIVGFATAAILSPLTIRDPWMFLASFPAGILLSGFVFDDWARWRLRREDHWLLTPERLYYFNRLESDSPASVALTDILRLSRAPKLGMTVTLCGREKLRMVWLPRMDTVRAAIAGAMA